MYITLRTAMARAMAHESTKALRATVRMLARRPIEPGGASYIGPRRKLHIVPWERHITLVHITQD